MLRHIFHINMYENILFRPGKNALFCRRVSFPQNKMDFRPGSRFSAIPQMFPSKSFQASQQFFRHPIDFPSQVGWVCAAKHHQHIPYFTGKPFWPVDEKFIPDTHIICPCIVVRSRGRFMVKRIYHRVRIAGPFPQILNSDYFPSQPFQAQDMFLGGIQAVVHHHIWMVPFQKCIKFLLLFYGMEGKITVL